MTSRKKTQLTCTPPPPLTPEQRAEAARLATAMNPANAPAGAHPPARLAALTQAYWGAKGVDLSVSFMETTAPELRDRILSHMNAWRTVAGANVAFRWTAGAGQVRISRGPGGYYSYLGPQVLTIPAGQQTMNLERFTMQTAESEFVRVVRHETGHTLGFPHEHLRPELVARLDPQKTVAYFMRTQGWSAQEVRQQVLTPLDERSLMATPQADAMSIMTYSLPGSITKDGRPIVGGTDVDAVDRDFAAGLYPLTAQPPQPPPPPPPPPGRKAFVVSIDPATWAATISPA